MFLTLFHSLGGALHESEKVLNNLYPSVSCQSLPLPPPSSTVFSCSGWSEDLLGWIRYGGSLTRNGSHLTLWQARLYAGEASWKLKSNGSPPVVLCFHCSVRIRICGGSRFPWNFEKANTGLLPRSGQILVPCKKGNSLIEGQKVGGFVYRIFFSHSMASISWIMAIVFPHHFAQ